MPRQYYSGHRADSSTTVNDLVFVWVWLNHLFRNEVFPSPKPELELAEEPGICGVLLELPVKVCQEVASDQSLNIVRIPAIRVHEHHVNDVSLFLLLDFEVPLRNEFLKFWHFF